MKRIIPFVIVIILMPAIAFAHSGGTDSSGGHHDYDNVSGLGDYHYHHGYGPHLHDGGVCPFDVSETTNNVSIDSTSYDDEEYTFTESELFDYVYDAVRSDPYAYNMISYSEYEELQEDYAYLKQSTIDSEKATNNVFKAIGITGAIGALACYYVYRKYNS